MALKLYSIFHVNLLYSSIPESRREEVIKRCLWPLLELALHHHVPIAIDSPVATLDVISRLDKQWVQRLREAIRSKLVEFVGSGYSQVVAPLVPARVNEWNLEIGRQEYKRILGVVPALWYINEQAYSAGIVEHYKRLGVHGVVMEWNNPRTLHPEWDDELKYYPQMAVGTEGQRVRLIWNDSICFQKLQRYAHGDIDAPDLLTFLHTHLGESGRYLSLYGNDAEIFDFRPGRFKAEPELERPVEWLRILKLYELLRADPRFQLIFPSEVLKSPPMPARSYVPLTLESSVQPIPVKKQPKYNVTRWSVTGRNSLYVNTLCHKLYRRIVRMEEEGTQTGREIEQLKKRLCFLWSSDFRTHITVERWQSFLNEIEGLARVTTPVVPSAPRRLTLSLNGLSGTLFVRREEKIKRRPLPLQPNRSEVSKDGRFLCLSTPSASLRFNLRRGLSVESLIFPKLSPEPLAGTIPHGYFKDIALSADWYTGNTVLQRPGQSQVTDLVPVYADLISGSDRGSEWLGCTAEIPTEVGVIRKRFKVFKNRPQVEFDYTFDWKAIPAGSFKTAFLTLIPESYDLANLFYATQNGGSRFEVFRVEGHTVAHNSPASSVVTASSGLGATEGIVVIGDARRALAICFDPSVSAAMPMVSFRQADPSFFARIMFSCGELDESRIGEVPGPLRFACSVVGMGRVSESIW
jgi:hypothetical protein